MGFKNFWEDPATSPYIEQTVDGRRFVNLCIYRLPGVTISDTRIQTLVTQASEIWCKCDLTIIANNKPIDLVNEDPPNDLHLVDPTQPASLGNQLTAENIKFTSGLTIAF